MIVWIDLKMVDSEVGQKWWAGTSKVGFYLELYSIGKVKYKLGSCIERYIEDITRWREHMKFIFEWKKYFTSEHSEQVKSFFHEKINFLC